MRGSVENGNNNKEYFIESYLVSAGIISQSDPKSRKNNDHQNRPYKHYTMFYIPN